MRISIQKEIDENKKKQILNIFEDTIVNFLYYDRKESTLELFEIEDAIIDGVVTVEDLTNMFKKQLESSVKIRKDYLESK